jgi:hypothetical protein
MDRSRIAIKYPPTEVVAFSEKNVSDGEGWLNMPASKEKKTPLHLGRPSQYPLPKSLLIGFWEL